MEDQAKQELISYMLSALNEEEKKIIDLRYKKGISWEHIPRHVDCGRTTCFRLHDRAIRKMSKEVGTF